MHKNAKINLVHQKQDLIPNFLRILLLRLQSAQMYLPYLYMRMSYDIV